MGNTTVREPLHLLYIPVRRSIAYGYVIALTALYVFVKGHTPLTIYTGLPHDDTLFMTLGQYLAAGQWLGPYNQFTLVKGPGFPAFLALTNWIGVSVALSMAVLHSAAVITLTIISHRFIRSYWISALLFTLLLWHPLSLSLPLLRILRDAIYYAQSLLLFALVVGAFFYATELKQRLWFAVLSGAVLGWFWLTREEGIWIVPAFALLFAAAILHALSFVHIRHFGWSLTTLRLVLTGTRMRQFGMTFAAMMIVFAGTQVGFRTINKLVYGFYVGVDFKEKNYQRALSAIHSVRSKGLEPSISVTRGNRELMYKVSPAFASLKGYLDGPGGAGWAAISCSVIKMSCDEIGVGWFIFALRDAAATYGYYDTAAKASAFFGELADEITAACERGELVCVRQPISEIPPISWEILKNNTTMRVFDYAFSMLLYLNPPLYIAASTANDESLGQYVRFLNNPVYERTIANTQAFVFSGWYYHGNRDWMRVTVKDQNGSDVPVRVTRNKSPDLVSAFKTEEASDQRFEIAAVCNDACTLQVDTVDGAQVEKKFAAYRPGAVGFQVGNGQMHVDITRVMDVPGGRPSLAERVANSIRMRVLTYYQYIFIPVLMLGGLAFVAATMLYRRRVLWNVGYVLALVSWGLTLARVMLLVVMAITTSTTVVIANFYAAPAFFFLVCGAVFSIAAWAQLFNSRRHVAFP